MCRSSSCASRKLQHPPDATRWVTSTFQGISETLTHGPPVPSGRAGGFRRKSRGFVPQTDIVTVNLYNAKDPNNITFEQRVIGDGNNAEEISSC